MKKIVFKKNINSPTENQNNAEVKLTSFKKDDNAESDFVFTDEKVLDALKNVMDPELPVSIVDLGLIYDLSKKGNKKDGYSLKIKMTLTAPGCGMGPSIAQDAESKVLLLPKVNDVSIEIVWDPVWDRSMMSEDAKLKLGMF